MQDADDLGGDEPPPSLWDDPGVEPSSPAPPSWTHQGWAPPSLVSGPPEPPRGSRTALSAVIGAIVLAIGLGALGIKMLSDDRHDRHDRAAAEVALSSPAPTAGGVATPIPGAGANGGDPRAPIPTPDVRGLAEPRLPEAPDDDSPIRRPHADLVLRAQPGGAPKAPRMTIEVGLAGSGSRRKVVWVAVSNAERHCRDGRDTDGLVLYDDGVNSVASADGRVLIGRFHDERVTIELDADDRAAGTFKIRHADGSCRGPTVVFEARPTVPPYLADLVILAGG